MNVIAMVNGREYDNAGMLKALRTLKIEKLFALANPETPWADFPDMKKKCTECYDNVATHEVNYEGRIETDCLIPLDTTLLDAFSPYMLTAIKMLERTRQYDIPFDERMDIIFKHLKYWNTVIDKHKIDLYVGLDVPHGGYNYIIYALCKIKGITTIFMQNGPAMGYSYTLDKIEDHCPQVYEEYIKLLQKYKDTPIEEIMLDEAFENEYQKQMGEDGNKLPYYMTNSTLPNSFEKFTLSKQNLIRLKRNLSWIFKMFSAPRNIKNAYRDFCFERDTTKYYENWEKFVKPLDMKNEKYIYFPLHYQPEATTTPRGGFFTWQYYAVALLNEALPKDVYIYVKENPKQTIKTRTLDFPQKLASLSNVKLVEGSTSTYQLIEDSIAVASITGTAVWEGLFKGKQAIMFGENITQYAPGVLKVKTLEDCKVAVEKILHQNCKPTHRELRIFSKAMENTGYFGFVDKYPMYQYYGKQKTIDGICNVLTNAFKKYLKEEDLNKLK